MYVCRLPTVVHLPHLLLSAFVPALVCLNLLGRNSSFWDSLSPSPLARLGIPTSDGPRKSLLDVADSLVANTSSLGNTMPPCISSASHAMISSIIPQSSMLNLSSSIRHLAVDVESWTAVQHKASSELLSRPAAAIELSSFCLVRKLGFWTE
ncbi:hypothetical protein GOBAR_DD11944 [Gossypium barbadense]|nr:hypothetical protein GOBAR_DD11944 [Gossypium barbadense]